jgi:hypothetical protein
VKVLPGWIGVMKEWMNFDAEGVICPVSFHTLGSPYSHTQFSKIPHEFGIN